MHRVLPWILLSLLLAGPALAQDGDADLRARELYDNGAALYEEGQYEDAIRAWQEAYRISERPLLLFNIANAQERIGRWRPALETLNRYRAFAPAEEREVLDRRMRNIERRMKEQEDQEAARLEVEEAALQEAQPRAQEPPSPTPPAGPSRAKGASIALLAGGLASAGVGVGLDIGALVKRQGIQELCREAGGSRYCPHTIDPLLAEEQGLSLGGDITLIAGGAVAGVGLVLLIVERVQGSKIPVTLAPTPGGVLVAGRF